MSSGAANSILRDVEPGCKTGMYYITIANLPFGTSWHELKDWLRCACTVEHVEIFNSSTSGWVRVKGEDNFRRAWARLNQGEFGGRSIIADGRNATERIKIKELIDGVDTPSVASSRSTRHPNPSNHQYAARSAPVSIPPTSPYGGQWPVNTMVTSPIGNTYVPYQLAMQQMQLGFETPPSSHLPHLNSADAYSNRNATYEYETGLGNGPSESSLGQQDYSLAHVSPHYASPTYIAESTDYITPPASLEEVVFTEQRKIIIKNLGHNYSEDQVRKLVKTSMNTVTMDKNQLQHIDFPPSKDGRPRGHIFVTFKTPEVARSVVQDLSGKPYQKRMLDVRLTNEGVSQEAGYHAADTRDEKRKDSHKERLKREKRDKEKGKSKHKDKENVCPEGAERRGERTPSTGVQAGHQDKSKTRPVIADGSSRKSR